MNRPAEYSAAHFRACFSLGETQHALTASGAFRPQTISGKTELCARPWLCAVVAVCKGGAPCYLELRPKTRRRKLKPTTPSINANKTMAEGSGAETSNAPLPEAMTRPLLS